ncbi:flagellar basal body-associated protein FliL [Bradyrhizobium sp. USDA 4506]
MIQYGYISGVAMIFEAIVVGVILLAVGYWATMFVMGRRDDVLHGKFVEEQPDTTPVRFMPHVSRVRPAQAATQPDRDSLQALLTVIKQDLHDAARS